MAEHAGARFPGGTVRATSRQKKVARFFFALAPRSCLCAHRRGRPKHRSSGTLLPTAPIFAILPRLGKQGILMASREHWGSRFGFIMAAAGSAVGLGNIWKFPYQTGANGGAAFLIIYLCFVALFGLSLVMAELLIGRTSQKNPIGAFRSLGGPAWAPVGAMGIVAGFTILSFYIVVAGWTLAYLLAMLQGDLALTDPQQLGAKFGEFISSPYQPIGYAALFMILTATVVIGGIGQGIERASRVLMPALFVLLLVLVGRSVTLDGAEEGLRFFLAPDWSKVNGDTFTSAIGQAFFSLSLGMGALLTYGSYLPSDSKIPGSAVIIVLVDSGVAILAGLMILPAVFAFGFDPQEGPGLTFVTLPAVFAAMPGGQIFGVLFFALLAVAALTSSISLLETVVCYFVDERGFSRHQVTIAASLVSFGLGIPASLSLGIWSDFTVPGTDKNIFDFMDFTASSVLLPLGGLLTALFVGWKWGHGALDALSNEGQLHMPPGRLWLFLLRFIVPLGIGWVLLQAFL